MVKLAVFVTAFAALSLAAVVADDLDDNTSVVIGSIVPDLPAETSIPNGDDDKPSFTLTGDIPGPTGHSGHGDGHGYEDGHGHGHGAGRNHTNGTEIHRNATASRTAAPTTSAFVAGAPINQGLTWSFAAALVGLVGYFA